MGQRRTWHETDDGYLWMVVVMDLTLVASVTVLLTETWYFADLTADVWTHSDLTCAPLVRMISSDKGVITLFHINSMREQKAQGNGQKMKKQRERNFERRRRSERGQASTRQDETGHERKSKAQVIYLWTHTKTDRLKEIERDRCR